MYRKQISILTLTFILLLSMLATIRVSANVVMQEGEGGRYISVPDRVLRMVDKPTLIEFKRVGYSSDMNVAGCEMIVIRKRDGKEIIAFTSEKEAKLSEGLFVSGETYLYKEKNGKGLHQSDEVKEFTVKDTGEKQTVVIKDATVLTVEFKASNGDDLSTFDFQYKVMNQAGEKEREGASYHETFFGLDDNVTHYLSIDKIPAGYEIADNNNLIFDYKGGSGVVKIVVTLHKVLDLPETGKVPIYYQLIALFILITMFIIVTFKRFKKVAKIKKK